MKRPTVTAACRLAALVAFVVLFPLALTAQTRFVEIAGDPLKIHVGADTAFQIFNSAVPGSGQVYPSSCNNVADAGMFAFANGRLVAPAFAQHGCGTATGNLGTYTPWVGSVSAVSGDGSEANPFTTTVRATSAAGVNITMVVQYVNGQNFFRLNNSFSYSGVGSLTAILAADIYLGGSDYGVFYYNRELSSPGGRDCGATPTYNILLIPITEANRFSARFYGEIWREISTGTLDNSAEPAGCVDNGAGLQWDDVMHLTGGRVKAAISFGDIPPASAFADRPFSVTLDPPSVTARAGETLTFNVTTAHLDPEFNKPLTLSLAGVPEVMTAALSTTSIPAPGDGTATLTVQLSPDIFPKTYDALTVVASDGEKSASASAWIDVMCDPPMVLAIDHPKSQRVQKGTPATLTVKAHRGEPVRYQWYRGHSPSTRYPIAGATEATYTTPAIEKPQEFWVRLSNSCGSTDTRSAMVTPLP